MSWREEFEQELLTWKVALNSHTFQSNFFNRRFYDLSNEAPLSDGYRDIKQNANWTSPTNDSLSGEVL